MIKLLTDLRAYAELAGNPPALTLAADELERLQRLAAEVLAIAERGETPDGDGVGVSVLLWAEGWARELGTGYSPAVEHEIDCRTCLHHTPATDGFKRLLALIEAVRDANAAASGSGNSFHLCTESQRVAWVRLMSALEGPA